MNTIGAAIDRGEIEVDTITWEAFNVYVPPCADCAFTREEDTGCLACALFDALYNSVEPEPASPMSSASLLSVIVRCSHQRKVTS